MERAKWFETQHGLYVFTPEQRKAAGDANQAYLACASRQPREDDAIAMLRSLKDEMCECKDRACSERVTQKMMKMAEQHKDTKATEAQMKQAAVIVEDLTRCMSRAMGMSP